MGQKWYSKGDIPETNVFIKKNNVICSQEEEMEYMPNMFV